MMSVPHYFSSFHRINDVDVYPGLGELTCPSYGAEMVSVVAAKTGAPLQMPHKPSAAPSNCRPTKENFWNVPSRPSHIVSQSKYKTELCNSWRSFGCCKYGSNCQFAHGEAELRVAYRPPKYKTAPCMNYFHNGICSYGVRCHFIHNEPIPPRRGVTVDCLLSPSCGLSLPPSCSSLTDSPPPSSVGSGSVSPACCSPRAFTTDDVFYPASPIGSPSACSQYAKVTSDNVDALAFAIRGFSLHETPRKQSHRLPVFCRLSSSGECA